MLLCIHTGSGGRGRQGDTAWYHRVLHNTQNKECRYAKRSKTQGFSYLYQRGHDKDSRGNRLEVRQLRREGRLMDTWTRDGIIFVKKTESNIKSFKAVNAWKLFKEQLWTQNVTVQRTLVNSWCSKNNYKHLMFKDHQTLSTTGSKAAVLRVVPEHCLAFKPTVLANTFHQYSDLFEQSHPKLPFNELLHKCDKVEIIVTQEQTKCVEQATKTQSSNKLWFRFRSGRVTASKMKRICRSIPDHPSHSLMKAMCYPEAASFTVAATQWFCKHEEVARAKHLRGSVVHRGNHTVGQQTWLIRLRGQSI